MYSGGRCFGATQGAVGFSSCITHSQLCVIPRQPIKRLPLPLNAPGNRRHLEARSVSGDREKFCCLHLPISPAEAYQDVRVSRPPHRSSPALSLRAENVDSGRTTGSNICAHGTAGLCVPAPVPVPAIQSFLSSSRGAGLDSESLTKSHGDHLVANRCPPASARACS